MHEPILVEDGLMSVKEGQFLFLLMSADEEHNLTVDHLTVFSTAKETQPNMMFALSQLITKRNAEKYPTNKLIPVYVSWADEISVQMMMVMENGSLDIPLIFERSIDRVIVLPSL